MRMFGSLASSTSALNVLMGGRGFLRPSMTTSPLLSDMPLAGEPSFVQTASFKPTSIRKVRVDVFEGVARAEVAFPVEPRRKKRLPADRSLETLPWRTPGARAGFPRGAGFRYLSLLAPTRPRYGLTSKRES